MCCFNAAKIQKNHAVSIFKNISEKPVFKQIFKVIKNKYFLVTVAFLVWIFFLDTNNLIVWYKDLRQLADQNRQKVYFQNEIKQTEEKLKELTSNKDSLEKFAREEYLFHESGEDVYVIEDSK